MSVLVDTPLLLDYLRGEAHAQALDAHARRAVSALTWQAVMAAAPAPHRERTRAFLRSFDVLPVDAAVADEALRLAAAHPGLDATCALNWATARVHGRRFLSADPHVAAAAAA